MAKTLFAKTNSSPIDKLFVALFRYLEKFAYEVEWFNIDLLYFFNFMQH